MAGTKDVGLYYKVDPSIVGDCIPVATYADASHEDVGTQSGISAYIGESVVDWRSTRQQLVAFNAAEAEVNALATGEAMHHSLLATLESVELTCTNVLWGDNTAANLLAVGQGYWRTRGLSTKVNAIKSRVRRNMLDLKQIGTTDQRGDGLTKSGGPKEIQHFRDHLGLRVINS